MKLKEGFIMRDVAGQTVVLPAGEDLDLNMMITLNDSAKFLWNLLKTEKEEAELVAALLSEYDVDEATAKAAVSAFVGKLKENGFFAN